MARPIVLTSLLYPVLTAAFMAQLCFPVARIATTYKSIELGLTAGAVVLISASFALFPAMLAIPLGRIYDRGAVRRPMIVGALMTPLALLLLRFEPSFFVMLLGGTILLGIVHGLVFSALQLLVVRSAGRKHRDRVLGRLMIVFSVGGATGPFSIYVFERWGLPLGNSMLVLCLCVSVLMATAVVFAARAVGNIRKRDDPPLTLGQLARTPRLLPVVILGSAFLTTQDLLLVFIPVLGHERGINAGVVGIMLGMQSVAGIVSRLFFVQLVEMLGRVKLLLVASVVAAVSVVGIAFPAPIVVTGLCLCVAGMTLPLALTCSIALVVQVAPPGGHATALSMRYAANRFAQFVVPLAASAVVSIIGIAGIFVALGATLAVSAVGLSRTLSNLQPHRRK